jgi:hypothetical protein
MADVAARERAMGELPSLPQASFGAAVPPDELLGRGERGQDGP